MRRAALSLVMLAACAEDRDWVVRPPGGGTGSQGSPVDAATSSIDAPAGPLDGLVCVVTDLRRPEVCPVIPAATDVLVRRAGDLDGARSGADARFLLAVTGDRVVLDVGADSAALQPSLVPVRHVGSLVHAPVPTAAAWTATVASLDVSAGAGTGAIALYLDEAAGGPAARVTVAPVAGSLAEPFYDGSSTTAWRTGGGTGALGAVLLVDVPPATYTLELARDAITTTVPGVPVAADTVTFLRARLPAP